MRRERRAMGAHRGRLRRGAWLLAASSSTLLLLGCDEVAGPDVAEGVYDIERWTLNASGCGSEGQSVLGLTGAEYFVVGKTGDGDAALVVGPCADPKRCEQLGALGLSGALLGLSVFETDDATRSSWESVELDLDIETWGDTCSATVSRATLTVEGDGRVRLERRLYTDVRYYAGEDEYGTPTCFVQDDVAEYGACRSLEVIVAKPEAGTAMAP